MRAFNELYNNNVKKVIKDEYNWVEHTTVERFLKRLDLDIEHYLASNSLAYEYKCTRHIKTDDAQMFLKEMTYELSRAQYIDNGCTIEKVDDADNVFKVNIKLKLYNFSNLKVNAFNFFETFNYYFWEASMFFNIALIPFAAVKMDTLENTIKAVICLIAWIPLGMLFNMTFPKLREHWIRESITKISVGV